MDNRIYMRKVLGESGVYNTDNPNINAELSSYEYGINKFYEECERVLGNCFIETADEKTLLKKASLFRKYVISDDTEMLRSQLAEKARLRGSSLSDIIHRLDAVGIKGEVSEGVNSAEVKVTSYEGTVAESAENELKKYMPVYISVTVV